MPKSFNLRAMSRPSAESLKDPRVLVRAALGILLAANLVAAMFAFHLFGASPESLEQELMAAQAQRQALQVRLNRSRVLTGSIDKGRAESENFLATYLTNRRHTYSTIISEIRQAEKTAGMNVKEETLAPLDPIEGSDDLDMMTVSINFEGGYNQLVRFVNLIDRSPRFLMIESLQAAPQPKGDVLSVNIKLNSFIKDDSGGAL
jgi:Tfp pilus assembly protein PilO